jgi:hypothetical protein
MSLHSYSRVWLHLVWATLERRTLLTKAAAARLSAYLTPYAGELRLFVQRYGRIGREVETVETVSMEKPAATPR